MSCWHIRALYELCQLCRFSFNYSRRFRRHGLHRTSPPPCPMHCSWIFSALFAIIAADKLTALHRASAHQHGCKLCVKKAAHLYVECTRELECAVNLGEDDWFNLFLGKKRKRTKTSRRIQACAGTARNERKSTAIQSREFER